MIPRTPLTLDPMVPASYGYWTPKKSELSEDGEGFGPFRNTWLIRGVTMRLARDVVSEESTLVKLIARLASDADAFDRLARALEGGSSVEPSDRLATPSILAGIEPHLDDVPPLEGLEVGVAGLVYALSAVGCWTAASCRSHPGEQAWTDRPVVFLAADRHRTQVLQHLVEDGRCGFVHGAGGLLVIEAESIEELMNLARLVLDARQAFIPPRADQRSRPKEDSAHGLQGTLDF